MRIPQNCTIRGRKDDQQPPPYDGILWVDEVPPMYLRGKDKKHNSRRKLGAIQRAANEARCNETDRPAFRL
jgi:hypothetical protein